METQSFSYSSASFCCGKQIVPIGHDRKNGKNHPDWKNRKLHKECWVDIKHKGGPNFTQTDH